MKIQRFKGKTAQEALEQARIALGPDALILQTRRIQAPGLPGLIGRPQVEVLAAVDTPESRPASQPRGDPRESAQRSQRPPSATPAEYSGASSRSPAGGADRETSGPVSPAAGEEWKGELVALRREVASLRSLLASVALSDGVPASEGGEVDGSPPTRVRWASALDVDPGLGGPPAGGSNRTASHAASGPFAVTPSIEELVRRLQAGLVTRPIEIRDGECTVVALVGPTGVGKTTTIAKLAAVASRIERKRVAFISADTYRIGAIEQLQTYANLLEIPMSVAYSRDDVKAARERYVGYDLVLMDTVGRSPSNYQQLQELASLLDVARPNEVHLALDARASYATQDHVLRGFRTLRPTHVLLSKLDETPRLEDSLAAALDGGLPLSYVTTGQRVPEDLAAADGAQLAAWLLGGR